MERKGTGEVVEKFRKHGNRDKLDVLARKLARWAENGCPGLGTDPDMPDALGDRESDISVPLVAVADAAGGEWPKRGRACVLAVFGRRTEADGNSDTGGKLLADIRAIFADAGAIRMASAMVCDKIGKMEERPWPEWKHGKPMTPVQLAAALRPYQVRPANMREPDGSVLKVTPERISLPHGAATCPPSITLCLSWGIPSRYSRYRIVKQKKIVISEPLQRGGL